MFDNVLAREFTTAKPHQAYVTDITYIRAREGWLYLTVFIDLFSRRVVGWSMGQRLLFLTQKLYAWRSGSGNRKPDWSSIQIVILSEPSIPRLVYP